MTRTTLTPTNASGICNVVKFGGPLVRHWTYPTILASRFLAVRVFFCDVAVLLEQLSQQRQRVHTGRSS